MSKSQVRKMAERLRNSPFVVPIFATAVLLALMSVLYTAADYTTSLYGVRLLPVNRVWPILDYAYAALPQALQIITGYAMLALDIEDNEDRKFRRAASLIFLLALVVDNGTDVWYTMSEAARAMFLTMTYNADAVSSVITSIGMSLTIHTIGSELMFVVGFGLTFQLMSDVIEQMRNIRRTIQGEPRRPTGGKRIHRQEMPGAEREEPAPHYRKSALE